MRVVLSSGHGLLVRGASGYIDEVDEARRVVNQTSMMLQDDGVANVVFHDNVSTTQNANLKWIVDHHNGEDRDLDISVHFNANVTTQNPVGTEVLYVSSKGKEWAEKVVSGIAGASGLINRGAKKRTDLYFLNNTEKPAILIETCFVDSRADADTYQQRFTAICDAIAGVISGVVVPVENTFYANGTCSQFGGPEDTGVDPDEGLAFISDVMQAPHLFLPYQPSGTTGLARRLNPSVHYVACRWDYEQTPREELLKKQAWVVSKKSGYGMAAYPADWGPNQNTGRVADLSPSLLKDLKLSTDDEVEVLFPM